MSLKFAQDVTNARILSVGAYRPPRVVPNSEIIKRIDSTDEWIQQRTGIQTRHFADADESLIDMAEKSALIAIERAGMTAQDIDAVIFATISYPYQAPSAATELLVRLGNVKAAAFDISAACAGFCYGIALANDLVRNKTAENVLVMGA
jgi:3-oxoacyl-(acyl-carrier-protein) synthase III